MTYTPLTQVPGCSKCGRPRKGHPLPYGANCTLALTEESANETTDTPFCGREGPVVPGLHGLLVPAEPVHPAADNATPVPVGQCPRPLDHTTPVTTASPSTITTTITPGAATECALAVLSTRLGQQSEEMARDGGHTEELSHQLNETSNQLTYISKVLDCLISGQTPATTPAAVTVASLPTSGSSFPSLGQAASHPQLSTASSSVNPSASSDHIGRQAALTSHTGFLQMRWDLQDHAQTLTF